MKHRNLFRAAVLTAGAVLFCSGVLRGEPDEILNRAVRVCLECIGIG